MATITAHTSRCAVCGLMQGHYFGCRGTTYMRHAHLDTRRGTASGTFGQLQECSSANLFPQTAQCLQYCVEVQAAMNTPPPLNHALSYRQKRQKRSRDRAHNHQEKKLAAGETIPHRNTCTHPCTHTPTTHHAHHFTIPTYLSLAAYPPIWRTGVGPGQG